MVGGPDAAGTNRCLSGPRNPHRAPRSHGRRAEGDERLHVVPPCAGAVLRNGCGPSVLSDKGAATHRTPCISTSVSPSVSTSSTSVRWLGPTVRPMGPSRGGMNVYDGWTDDLPNTSSIPPSRGLHYSALPSDVRSIFPGRGLGTQPPTTPKRRGPGEHPGCQGGGHSPGRVPMGIRPGPRRTTDANGRERERHQWEPMARARGLPAVGICDLARLPLDEILSPAGTNVRGPG